MNTNQKESLLIMAVAAALLIYLNIPQWLLCYIRPSFIVTTNTGGFVNSIIFVADKNQDLENDIQETFDGLYIDTPSEFTSNDFSSDDEKKSFQSKIDKALNLLIDRYGSEYEIESKYQKNSR